MNEPEQKKPTKAKAEKPAKAAKVAKPKVEKPAKAAVAKCERKNGVSRPKAGGKTSVVWEIADAISSKNQRPAFRHEVLDAYLAKVPDGSHAMAATNYSLWCKFNGATVALRKLRASDRKEKEAAVKQAAAEKKAAANAKKKEQAAAAKADEKKAA